ncbi:hypothetical protein WJX72_011021 [[Myrmecia] bisecta]|uniref:mannan endo-1,4-beta-mannosidase n=1 Tax=[Myrmecia] bisecta TaxID=41462 RepID=A0AAW1Q767_9CHLO
MEGRVLRNKYNETVFRGIDRAIAVAGKYGMKAIISFVDFWKPDDGIQVWSYMCDDGSNTDKFYTSDKCKTMFRQHISNVLNRRNTYNNRLYKDDPTIMAWDTANEPRCQNQNSGSCHPDITQWVIEMAAYIKSVDPNHLVTTGGEGFFLAGTPEASSNPGAWGGQTGQDFVAQTSSTAVDFASIHLWPQNWLREDLGFVQQWVTAHMTVAAELNIPLVMEEFGYKLYPSADYKGAVAAKRDPYFQACYNAVQQSVQQGQVLKGAMFWEWDIMGPAEKLDVSSRAYTTTEYDSTW